MTDFISPHLITIPRGDRQRRDLGDLSELKASIATLGIINPIIIDEDNILIAGERRLTSALELGLDQVPIRYFSDLDEVGKHLVELDENVKRLDLTWQEHVNAVHRYHSICMDTREDWNEAKTADALGTSPSTVNRQLFVYQHTDNPLVKDAQVFSVALNAAKRIAERRQSAGKQTIDDAIEKLVLDQPATPVELAVELSAADGKAAIKPTAPAAKIPPILNTNFLTWAPPAGRKFNFIHCDFPYGIGTGDKVGQSAAKHSGTYDDSFETYRTLLDYFCNSFIKEYLADQAHLMFWFSMKFYTETKQQLEDAGWSVNPVPLIWMKSDNKGILPDPNRSPRQITEFALLASWGDRKIVRAKSNAYHGPTTRDTHTSEKPRAMLDHFFEMLVDDSTTFLDPTCGSGNSVITAHKRGAARVTGLEINREFALSAAMNWEKETMR